MTGSVTATDPEGGSLTYKATTSTKGTVAITSAGVFTYTPTAMARHAAAKAGASNATTTDTVKITVTDVKGAATTVAVNVQIMAVNAAPVAGSSSIVRPDPSTGVVVGPAIATDADGDKLVFSVTQKPASGSVTVAANGTFTYKPTDVARKTATAATTDSFTVLASDGYGGAISVPITVRILPVATVTQGLPDIASGVVTGSVTAPNLGDGSLSYAAPTSTPKGSVSIDAKTGAFTYTPTAVARHIAAATNVMAADKTDAFNVSVIGSGGEVQYIVPVTVTLRPQNSDPTATGTAATFSPSTGVITGAVIGNDPDADVLTYTASAVTPEGRVVIDNATGKYIYTPVSRTDTVTSIIAGFISPSGVVFSPNGSRAYISDSAANSISVVDTSTNRIVSVVGGFSTPTTMAVTPDGRNLYVVGATSVAILDTATNTVRGNISGLYAPTGASPSPKSIAVSPDGKFAFVVNSTYAVSVVNTATNQVVKTINLATSPSTTFDAVIFSPDGKQAYVTRPNGYYIGATKIDTTTYKVSSYQSGRRIFSPDGLRSYILEGSAIYAEDAKGSIVATRTLRASDKGNSIRTVALSSDGSLLYGLDEWGAIYLYDPATLNPLGAAKNKCGIVCNPSIKYVFPNINGIAVSPDGTRVYAVNSGNGTVSVLTKWTGQTADNFNVTVSDGHGGTVVVPVAVNFLG